MKEKLFRLETKKMYAVSCKLYARETLFGSTFIPKGSKNIYFDNFEDALNFHREYEYSFLQSSKYSIVSNAGYPFEDKSETYIEVSEQEALKILEVNLNETNNN